MIEEKGIEKGVGRNETVIRENLEGQKKKGKKKKRKRYILQYITKFRENE